MHIDFETCYRAIQSRDPRFDGQFFTAVTSTGIYCRPICTARTPHAGNVRFYASSAAAQAAGFRACKRCRPESAPGSSEWNVRADLVARALRLIADGIVDAEGVAGLACRLAVSPRHVHRELMAEVGAGPLALARTRRAQTARLLIDGTSLPLSDVAFTAGFGSIRQFNDSMRQAFGSNPGELRRRDPASGNGTGTITLRLAGRPPFAATPLLEFLGHRAIPGLEEMKENRYRRTISIGGSKAGIIELEPRSASHDVLLHLRLDDLRDLGRIVNRCRQLFDLDVDPEAVSEILRADPALAPSTLRLPGLRVPGAVDGWEIGVRAVLGQQISVLRACTLAEGLVARLGTPIANPEGALTHLFPTPRAVAEGDLSGMGIMPRRAETLRVLARAILNGSITLERSADREETVARLLNVPGIGPWTSSYIAMRALGDPDAFPASDLGVRMGFRVLGLDSRPSAIAARAERWRPWRSYAAMHLWQCSSTNTVNSEAPA
ncbi:MAG: AlkA N-terminal domain-containing protein [Chloroflexota bacterium]